MGSKHLPFPGVYPEAGVHKIAQAVKKRIEEKHTNISVNVTLFGDSNQLLILDSEITKPLFQNVSL